MSPPESKAPRPLSSRRQGRAAIGGSEPRVLRGRWQELIKRIYEVDPLVCPNRQAEICIIAFVIDHAVADKILRRRERKGTTERERGPPGAGDLGDAS